MSVPLQQTNEGKTKCFNAQKNEVICFVLNKKKPKLGEHFVVFFLFSWWLKSYFIALHLFKEKTCVVFF